MWLSEENPCKFNGILSDTIVGPGLWIFTRGSLVKKKTETQQTMWSLQTWQQPGRVSSLRPTLIEFSCIPNAADSRHIPPPLSKEKQTQR